VEGITKVKEASTVPESTSSKALHFLKQSNGFARESSRRRKRWGERKIGEQEEEKEKKVRKKEEGGSIPHPTFIACSSSA
jgi:hypothetical protein